MGTTKRASEWQSKAHHTAFLDNNELNFPLRLFHAIATRISTKENINKLSVTIAVWVP